MTFEFVCACCGEEFTAGRANARFCSTKCRQWTWRQARRKVMVPVPCVGCGREFSPTTAWSRHCTTACSDRTRQRRWRQREKTRYMRTATAAAALRTVTFANDRAREAAERFPCRCLRSMWGLVDGERRCLHCGRRPT